MEEDDNKNQQGWGQNFTDSWMIDANIVTPEYLQKIRYTLLIVFPLKQVDVDCDIEGYKMEWVITFKIMRTLFKSREVLLKKVHSQLQLFFTFLESSINFTPFVLCSVLFNFFSTPVYL